MFGNKSPFGQSTTNTSFGGGSSLFGQNKSMFGQPQQPAQQQTTSLFGQKPSGSLFGTSTASSAPSAPLFGSSTPQSNTSGGLFGQSKPSLFGASSNNATFGASSTSLFGNSQQQQQSSTASIFGTSSAAPSGTSVKFEPFIGQDTMQKNNTSQSISTKHMCITAMKQYEGKNLEELRVDDYLANRKTPAASGGGLFGASAQKQPATTGLFGQSTQNKSIFGATSTPAFGSSSGGSGGSLFGSSTQSGPSAFGAKPTTSLFGSTTSPFGASAPAAGTSLFGAPAAAPTFGQPAAQTGTGLFGSQPATSAPTSAFSFGAPATTTFSPFGAPSFGQPAASTASLFGKPAPAAAPAFAFGAQPTASPFGAPTTLTASSGLFGAKPGVGGPSLFGAAPAASSGGLFGSTPTAMAPFGATTAAAPAAVTAPVELVTNISQVELQVKLMEAQLANSPYGDSPLLTMKKSSYDDSEDKPNPTSTARQLRFLAAKCSNGMNSTSFAPAPRIPAAASKLADTSRANLVSMDLAYTPSITAPTLGRGLRTVAPSGGRSSSITGSSTLDTSIEHSLRGSSNRLSNPHAPRTSIKYLDPSALDNAYAAAATEQRTRDPDELPPVTVTQALTSSVISPTMDAVAAVRARGVALREGARPQLNLDATMESMPVNDTPSSSPSDPRRTEQSTTNGELPTCDSPGGVKLRSSDYFTNPSIEAMKSMMEDGRVVLADGLTVGRATFGSVYWPGRIELKDVTLDDIVVFRHKEVTVYPDESVKPPRGSGLNRPAEITLERIWPFNKATKKEIKDVKELLKLGWREKLERRTAAMDANFKDYRPDSGSWVFRVKHFSKYGLPDDSDEEEERAGKEALALSRREEAVQGRVQRSHVRLSPATASLAPPLPDSLGGVVAEPEEAAMETANAAILGLGGRSCDLHTSVEMIDGCKSWRSVVPGKKIKLEMTERDEICEGVGELADPLDGLRRGRQEVRRRERTRHFLMHCKKGDSLLVPFKGLIDQAAAHGRTAPVAWAAGGLFAASVLPTENAIKVCKWNYSDEYETAYIIDMFEHHQRLSQRISRHRSSSARARHCELDSSLSALLSSAPHIKPSRHSAQLIHSFLVTTRQSGRAEEALLWELCGCLFPVERSAWHGPLSEWQMSRAVGNWLKGAVASEGRKGKSGVGRAWQTWEKLTQGKLEEAVEAAQAEGLTFLSVLISAFTIDPQSTRPDFLRQIEVWCSSGVVWTLDSPLLKIYLTLAGLSHLSFGGRSINCLEGLSWQSCLGLRMWYSEWATVLSEGVEWLEEEGRGGRVTLPTVSVQLELLRLLVDRSRPIEILLDAAVEDDDVHLAWHLWSILRAANLPSMNPGAEQRLHALHAEQLVQMGLPHLALFVLAHINNAQCRSLAMREVLERRAVEGEAVDYEKAVEMTGLPEEWVAAAKALSAKREGDIECECRFALEAHDFSTAHHIFLTQVAPNLLCVDDLKTLSQFCEMFEGVSDSIPGWGSGGQLYADYIELKTLAMAEDDEELEKLTKLQKEIVERIHIDSRSTPIQLLAMSTVAREMVEIEEVLFSRIPASAPLTTNYIYELAAKTPFPLDD